MDCHGGAVRFLKSIGLLVFALILQTTVVRLISIGPIKPDLVIIALVIVALRTGPLVGLYSGLIIGLIQDIYSIEHLGAHALSMSLVGYLMGLFFNEGIIRIVPLTKVLVLAAAFFAHDLIFSLAVGMGEASGIFLWERSLPAGLYTLVLGWITFLFLPAAPLDER